MREPHTAAMIEAVLVTGMSGAGRASCLRVLEDQGFEAVDNLPLALLSSLFRAGPPEELQPPGADRIAVGVDCRTRDFDAERFLAQLTLLRQGGQLRLTLLFLDCDDEVLLRRFTETRRRHPLAADRTVSDGLRIERAMLQPIRDRADLVIDTSQYSLTEFRRIIGARLTAGAAVGLSVSVLSFGFRNGLPREADMVFDVRFLRNPHYDLALRPLDGRNQRVGAFVSADRFFEPFLSSLQDLLGPLLPRYRDEGKSYLTIAVGCTGGRHRSVYTAERLAAWLQEAGHTVNLQHRDVDLAEANHG